MNDFRKIGLVLFIPVFLTSSSDGGLRKFNFCVKSRGLSKDTVFSRGTSSYRTLNRQWMQRGGTSYPLAYFLPRTSRDVADGVRCAQQAGLRSIPKGGGHSFGKYAYGGSDSVVFDLQRMDKVQVLSKEGKVILGPGLLLAQMYWRLWEAGKYFVPGGDWPAVGVSGLVLGGGYSRLSRSYGLTLDHLLEAEIVLADSRVLKTNSQTNRDLFWSLRGGGGGSFGIVSSLTFKLLPAPVKISQRFSSYDFIQFPSVFQSWEDLTISKAPNRYTSSMYLSKNGIKVEVTDAEGGSVALVQTFLSTFPPSNHSKFRTTSFIQYILNSCAEGDGGGGIPKGFFRVPSDLDNITRSTEEPRYTKVVSFYVKEPFGLLRGQVLFSILESMPPHAFVIFDSYGGAIENLRNTETAFIHREGIIYHVFAAYGGRTLTPAQILSGETWLQKFFKETEILIQHNESYQNYVDPYLTNPLQRYYGSNLKRLIEAKRDMDSTNYFHNPQSIPTGLEREGLLPGEPPNPYLSK